MVDHLGEDAPDAPHVDGGAVVSRPEENLGRAVPQRHHLVRVRAHGDPEGTREAEIGEFERVRALVHQKVLGLEVAVQDAVRVAIRDARAHLVQVALDDASVVADVRVGVEMFLEIHVQELEHEIELLVLVNHVHQAAARGSIRGRQRFGVSAGEGGSGGGAEDRLDRGRDRGAGRGGARDAVGSGRRART